MIFPLLFLFAFPYRNILDLTRFTLSASIFLYGYLRMILKEERRGLILMIISAQIHFGISIVILMFFLSKVVKKIKLTRITFFTSIMLSFFLPAIIKFSLRFLPISSGLKWKITKYIFEANSGIMSLLSRGITGIFEFITIVTYISFALYLIKNNSFYKTKKLKKLYDFLKLFSLIMPFFYFNRVLNERYGYVYQMLFICFLFYEKKMVCKPWKKSLNKNILAIFFCLIALKTIYINMRYIKWSFSSGYDVIKSNEAKRDVFFKLFYLPTSSLVNFNKNSYNNEWFEKNIHLNTENYEYLLKKIKEKKNN